MKIKDLPIGTIFTVPLMPQWGVMMISYLKETDHDRIIVYLTGNCWSYRANAELDDDLEVEVLDEVKSIINHVKRSTILKNYSS